MRLYLDNCCFNRPFDDQKQIKIHLETEAKLFIQQKILEGEYELVWSYILEYENSMNPFEARKKAIMKWKSIAQVNVEQSENILNSAKQFTDKGIKSKDALHIACSIEAKSDFFITTDKKLLNFDSQVEQIRIINPIDFIDGKGDK